MHRFLTLLVAVSLSTNLLAAPFDRNPSGEPVTADDRERVSRQFIVEPQRVLSSADEASLSNVGVHIQKVLGAGRYLVRTDSPDALAKVDLLVRSAEPVTPELKLHATAVREASKPVLQSRLSLIFEEGVAFTEAAALVQKFGGRLESLTTDDFDPMQRLVVRVPPANVRALAADTRILAVYGAPRFRLESENAQAAQLSSVTPLYSAPYDLTGKNVMLAFFEIGSAMKEHPEFGGRLDVRFSNASSDGDHATHVAGTIIAEGKAAAAKGMAPAANLTGFGVSGTSWLREKRDTLKPLGAVGDNNSWGYVLGWVFDSDAGGWVWTGNADLYGGYIDVNASLDKITRDSNVLMLHSAGNDASKLGPESSPFVHMHEDDNGDPITGEKYCYSTDGSGNDCPTALCSTGPQFCEVVRHPVNAPLRSLGLLASTKNALTVGAASDATSIATFSSRGPTIDGRVKPEIVARGVGVYSTIPGGGYGRKNGTSMATPVVTGISGLVVEQWRRTFSGASPAANTLKTVLIAGATDMGNAGPDYVTGFGLANAKATVDLIRDDNASGSRIRVAEATQGSQLEIPITVSSAQNLRVTLGWADPEVLIFGDDGTAAVTLVNDLDVKVIDANGATVLPYVLDKNVPEQPATRGVNKVDTTEMVEISNAAPGTYRAVVSGTRIAASSPQQFTLVSNAPMGSSAVPCSDPTEPNNTADTGYGLLGSTQSVMGRLCAADDVDFFRFRPDRPGTVAVQVTATGTPLRVTLSGNGGETSADLAAGETRTLQLSFSGTTPTVFTARVQANGSLGADTSYFVTPTFGLSAPARRRVR